MPLASALGLGMLSGARLYATVFIVGLLLRFHSFDLPAAWQHASVLADTRVLIVAGIACAIEFVADKVPWVDSVWDSIHTFIRPIGAALLTSSLMSGLSPAYQVLLFLLAGGVAFSGHAAKAATRLAVNHSPEPFSNIALSLGEDAVVAGGLYLLVRHPWIMAAIVVVFLALFAWLAPSIYRALRAEGKAVVAVLKTLFGYEVQPRLNAAQVRWLTDRYPGRSAGPFFSVIVTKDVEGLRNAAGTLCLVGRDAALFTRRWRRPVERSFGNIRAIEVTRGLLLDQLVLVDTAGARTRFDLLAGQLETARREAGRFLPAPPRV